MYLSEQGSGFLDPGHAFDASARFASLLVDSGELRRSGRPLFLVALGTIDSAVSPPEDSVLVRLPPLDEDSGVRLRAVPLVVRSLARIGCADVRMNSLDIAPTVCGLAGVPPLSGFVGRDYSGLVAGPRASLAWSKTGRWCEGYISAGGLGRRPGAAQCVAEHPGRT